MSEIRIDLDVTYTQHVGVSIAETLVYRVSKNINVTQTPDTLQSLDTLTPTTLQYTMNDSRVTYPGWSIDSSAGVSVKSQVRPVVFVPLLGVSTTNEIPYVKYTEKLNYSVINKLVPVTEKVLGSAYCTHRNIRTQQIEVLRQLTDLQNSQPLTLKVLRKYEEDNSPGTGGPTIIDKDIPIGITVSYDSYVGIGSPTNGRFSTIATDSDNTDPEEYVDESIIKIDQSTPAFRLITGKNDVKLSLQITPTYVISKRNKD